MLKCVNKKISPCIQKILILYLKKNQSGTLKILKMCLKNVDNILKKMLNLYMENAKHV